MISGAIPHTRAIVGLFKRPVGISLWSLTLNHEFHSSFINVLKGLLILLIDTFFKGSPEGLDQTLSSYKSTPFSGKNVASVTPRNAISFIFHQTQAIPIICRPVLGPRTYKELKQIYIVYS